MARGKDSAGHRYEEFDMSDNEQVRVTYIPHHGAREREERSTGRIHRRSLDDDGR